MIAFYTSCIFGIARVSFWATVLPVATAEGVSYGAAGILSRLKLAAGGAIGALGLLIGADDVLKCGHDTYTLLHLLHERHTDAPRL